MKTIANKFLRGRVRAPKGKRIRRFPRQVYPKPLERAYLRELLAIYAKIKTAVEVSFIPKLSGIVPRRDSWGDDLDDLIRTVRLQLGRDTTEAEIDELALRTGRNVSAWQSKQLKGGLKRVLDLDVFFTDAGLSELLTGWAYENTRLITKLTDDVLNEIEGVVSRGIQSGETWQSLKDQILGTDIDEGIFGSREYRAELIARDQVGKLYGELSNRRQSELGITEYIWRTAKDERVRSVHADREGKRFRWDDPPEGGHPGEDFQCRCYAEPVIPELE